jgi:hypothetical protein
METLNAGPGETQAELIMRARRYMFENLYSDCMLVHNDTKVRMRYTSEGGDILEKFDMQKRLDNRGECYAR